MSGTLINPFAFPPPLVFMDATGGTITTFVGDGTNAPLGHTMRVHTFTAGAGQTLNVLTAPSSGIAELLIAAGGGGGGQGRGTIGFYGGGGGAGGSYEGPQPFAAGAYTIAVGGGGGGGARYVQGGDGGDSTITIPGFPAMKGGGGGGSRDNGNGRNGGCGGGCYQQGWPTGVSTQLAPGVGFAASYLTGGGATGIPTGRTSLFDGTSKVYSRGGSNDYVPVAHRGDGGGGTIGGSTPGSGGVCMIKYRIA